MHFNQRKARVARVASLGALTLGTTAAVAAQAHPAAAAGIFAALNSAITCATTGACVSGTNTASGLGVEGTSTAGYGVFGLSKGTGTGVFGGAQSGFGMYGYSNTNDGVEGVSTNLNGVEGLSFATNGTAVGVKGSTSKGNGKGVWGTVSGSGYGVEGSSQAGYGVFGLSEGTGTGVFGGAQSGFGMYGYSNTNDGIEGVSTNNYGVEGLSFATSANAVGVKGSTSQGNGQGVWGDSAHGSGVYGSSQTGVGIYGKTSSGTAVFGLSDSQSGVWGQSNAWAGVSGQSNVYPFVGANANGVMVFNVDGKGNIFHAGIVTSASRASDGTTIAAYSAKLTSPTVEDTGTAQLVAGGATVLLDPVFARTIDSASSYRVFVTANGDTHGLFVGRKTALGFAVHENEGGRSTVSFDYRIVATALGYAGQRMAVTKPSAMTPLGSARRPSTPLLRPTALPRLPGYSARP